MTTPAAIPYSATRPPRGLSLVEVVVATLLTGLILVTSLRCLIGVTRGRLNTGESGQAILLAQEFMTEIQNLDYEDPASPVFGVESGEVAVNRGSLDDVDDYASWSATPPQDRQGNPLSQYAGWQQECTVQRVLATDPNQAVSSDQGLKRITVTIRKNGKVLAQQVSLRCNL